MRRAFVAIAMPPDISLALETLQQGLAGARWARPEGLHLPLAFLGNLDENRLHDADATLNAARGGKFELTLSGLGQFGDDKPRAVWAGFEPSDPLIAARKRVDADLRRARFTLEARKFVPHVTLARLGITLPDRVAKYLARHGLFRVGPFPVNEITLFESLLGNEAPVYEPLATYPLK